MTQIKALNTPETILLLGTDASGKNHVANFMADMIAASGHTVEKRDGWLSKEAADIVSSEDKSSFDLMKEQAFITAFRVTKSMIPLLAGLLVRLDLIRFRRSNRRTIVIGHHAFRVLAFYLGHVCQREEEIIIPGYLDRILRAIVPATGVKSIVLDIDDRIRKQRIARRQAEGKADVFDRYMAEDGVRSERIENYLVWLSRRYLNAYVLENNDLDERELADEINRAFTAFGTR